LAQLSRFLYAEPPRVFIKLTWSDFVQHVLEVTVEAYQAMREARVARREWEENVFTIQLADGYIRPLLQQYESPIRVWARTKIHTVPMYNGEQPTIQAKEVDMLLFDIGEWEYRRVNFVWEAKCVGDKRVNYDKYSPLNSEYVNEAIYRFIRREYAAEVDDAGILAYVLEGCVNNIINDINASMGRIRKNPSLPKSEHLQGAPPIGDFEDIYRSRHKRSDDTYIGLYHFILTFDFE
jgi:hypothetical protein